MSATGNPDFLAHDRRAALEDVIEGLSAVSTEVLPEDERRQIERARAAGGALARLLDGAQGADATDLTEMLEAIDSRLGGRAVARGLALGLVVGPGVPRQLALDAVVLDRILVNLLARAIAMTASGTVRLSVVSGEDEALVFSVVPGEIAPTRTVPDLDRQIAVALAEGLGATLMSGTDAATHLVVPGVVWGQGGGAPAGLAGVRVWLCGLAGPDAAALKTALTALGAEVAQCVSMDAEIPASTPVPDLVVVDFDSAGLNGPAAVRRLRQMAGWERVPIAAVTADILAPSRGRIQAAGADGLLARPLPGPALLAAILHEIRAAAAQPDGADEGLALDRAKFDHLMAIAGDAVADELLARLVEDLAGVADTLAAAVPGLDLAEIRGATHVLISLAGAVGADRLQGHAEALNAAAHAADAPEIARIGALARAELAALSSFVRDERSSRGEAP